VHLVIQFDRLGGLVDNFFSLNVPMVKFLDLSHDNSHSLLSVIFDLLDNLFSSVSLFFVPSGLLGGHHNLLDIFDSLRFRVDLNRLDVEVLYTSLGLTLLEGSDEESNRLLLSAPFATLHFLILNLLCQL
jgi:hypothetical protein